MQKRIHDLKRDLAIKLFKREGEKDRKRFSSFSEVAAFYSEIIKKEREGRKR